MSTPSGAPRAVILVVDDDPLRACAVTRILQAAGYEVATAANARECFAALATRLPHLILLDVVLPDASGLEVCVRLRADPSFSRLAIVMFSAARRSSRSQAAGLEAGADGYLAWPVSRRELLARVAVALRQGRPASARADATLSPRQRQVIELIARGQSCKAVAEALGITVRTAETHRAAVLRRLKARNTADAVRRAWELGLVR